MLDTQWACAACTFVNFDQHLACAVCGTERPERPERPEPIAAKEKKDEAAGLAARLEQKVRIGAEGAEEAEAEKKKKKADGGKPSHLSNEQLEFYFQNGYLLLPPGSVPLDMLQDAMADAEAGAPYGSTCSDKVFDLYRKTKLHSIVGQLLGSEPAPDFRGWAQIASVGREEGEIPGSFDAAISIGRHIDLGHNNKPCCSALAGTHPDRFSLLLGIPLTPCPDYFMGNFGVYPGSHLQVAKAIAKHGGFKNFFNPLDPVEGAEQK
jgi:hypothetical protein